jgi:hypothetical protein
MTKTKQVLRSVVKATHQAYIQLWPGTQKQKAMEKLWARHDRLRRILS